MSERLGGASVTVDAVAERIAQARVVKALALVREIRKQTAESVKELPDEGWRELAKRAGVNEPSQTTAKLVIALLETA